jgi:hypothetical protein
MRMIAVVASAVAVSLLVVAPATPAAKRARCRPTHSRTLVKNSRARVYDRKDRRGLFVAYACVYRSGKRYRLSDHDDANGEETDDVPTLSGPYLAYSVNDCPGTGDECYADMRVLDLRNGKRRRPVNAFGAESDDTFVTDIVLDTRGDVGWIAESDNPRLLTEVRVATSRGVRTVDSARDIARHSLARAGRRIYWMRGGRPKTAKLR